MPLDVNDYKEILALVARVENKIDALRRDFVAADVQKFINDKVDERFKDVNKRIGKVENAPIVWVTRGGIVLMLLFSFLQLLVSLKVLP